MKKLNRLVAGLLTLAMAVGLTPTAAFAQGDYYDYADEEALYTDASDIYDDTDDALYYDTLSLDDDGEGDITALAEGETASGTCGDNLTWTLEDGVLTISGEGEMSNSWFYFGTNGQSPAPWYAYKSSIEHIVVEDGVTSIGNYAFYNLTELVDIVLPDSLISIEEGAFRGTPLESIDLPDGLESIGAAAFADSEKLKCIVIPEGIESIESSTFSGCTNLESVTLPQSIISIGNLAFCECEKLESIDLPDGIETIGRNAFWQCYGLQNIVLPSDITSIEAGTFDYCYNLKNIVIPSKVTSIGWYSFNECRNLATIKFTGECPSFETNSFWEITTTAYYPSYWAEVPSSTVGGATNITWVPYDPNEEETCEHLNTTIINAKEATATEDGYTGDTQCEDCGKIIEKGEVIPATGSGEQTSSLAVLLSVVKTDEEDDDNWKYQATAKITLSNSEAAITDLDVSWNIQRKVDLDKGNEELWNDKTDKIDFIEPGTTETVTWDISIPKMRNDKIYVLSLGLVNDDTDVVKKLTFNVDGIGTNDYIFRYGEDNYSFGNDADVFEDTYYITDSDMQTFLKSEIFKPVERAIIAVAYVNKEDRLKWMATGGSDGLKKWDGSCYGMSCTMALFRAGYLDTTSWETDKGDVAQDTYSIKAIKKGVDDDLESMINIYTMSQFLWARPTYRAGNSHDEKSFVKMMKEMWEKASNIGEYGAGQEPFIIILNGELTSGGVAIKPLKHAVVCYGAESCTYEGGDEISYDKRLRVADPNAISDKETFESQYIYISDDFKNAYFTGDEKIEKDGILYETLYNIFGYIHAELSDMDVYNYNSRTVNSSSRMNSVYADGMKNFTISSGGKTAIIENNEITGGELELGPYYTVKALPEDELNDTSSEEEAPLWVMEENHSNYSITPSSSEELDATIFFDDIALTVTGDASSAVYNDDGTVTVKDAVGNIAIRAAVNDGNLTFASVEGDANGDVTVKFNTDSLTVSGDIDNVIAKNSDIEGNESEIELDDNGTAYADVNGTLTTDKGNVTPSEPTDPSTPSSGGDAGMGAGIAIAGAAAVVGTAVALKASQQATATAALPDKALIHVTENGAEKVFDVAISGKAIIVKTEANAAVLTGARSYLEQLAAQGYTQLTLSAKTSEKTLYILPVTKETTVDISALLASTPQNGTFSVTVE